MKDIVVGRLGPTSANLIAENQPIELRCIRNGQIEVQKSCFQDCTFDC